MGDLLAYGVGGLQLALALVVARRLGALGPRLPWLLALTAYFALRGVTRIVETSTGELVDELAVPVDVLLVGVLALLIVGFDRTMRGLRYARDAARYREAEYERALADYRRLARHRLATPLTAIRGGIAAVRALDLTEQERADLLDMVDREAARLEAVTLEPQPLSPEERRLRPRPSADAG